jgi:hypothetical protein
LRRARAAAGTTIAAALEDFDPRRAVDAIITIAREGNRFVVATRPWELAKVGDEVHLDAVAGGTGGGVPRHRRPPRAVPTGRRRAHRRPVHWEVEPEPVFPRLSA